MNCQMKRIAAEYVFTGTGGDPVRNAYVEYGEDGTVTSFGVSPDVDAEPDFRRGILVPGFVNSHCHLELSHLRGKFAKGTGMSGFINQINELRDFTTVENKKAEAAVSSGAADADKAVVAAVSAIDKAAGKGVLHKNTAARRVSRVMRAKKA